MLPLRLRRRCFSKIPNILSLTRPRSRYLPPPLSTVKGASKLAWACYVPACAL